MVNQSWEWWHERSWLHCDVWGRWSAIIWITRAWRGQRFDAPEGLRSKQGFSCGDYLQGLYQGPKWLLRISLRRWRWSPLHGTDLGSIWLDCKSCQWFWCLTWMGFHAGPNGHHSLWLQGVFKWKLSNTRSSGSARWSHGRIDKLPCDQSDQGSWVYLCSSCNKLIWRRVSLKSGVHRCAPEHTNLTDSRANWRQDRDSHNLGRVTRPKRLLLFSRLQPVLPQ